MVRCESSALLPGLGSPTLQLTGVADLRPVVGPLRTSISMSMWTRMVPLEIVPSFNNVSYCCISIGH